MAVEEEVLEVRVGRLLGQKGLKLAVAESCTGGLVADRLTDVPGSSEYFLGGIVAYAYEAKVSLLGVSWDTLKAHGAVSRETVLEMARGARKALAADVGISVRTTIFSPGRTPMLFLSMLITPFSMRAMSITTNHLVCN